MTARTGAMRRTRRRHAGLSLVELMVALLIGSLLIIGAVTVYANSRTTYSVNEAVARLQEQGRYALSIVEPDIELAGFYGFTNSADTLRLVRGAEPEMVLATAAALRQQPIAPADPTPVPAPGLAGGAQACGTNFAVDVLMPVQGSNDAFALGPDATGACAPFGAGAAEGSDTLTLRRASTRPVDAQAGRLQIFASRLNSQRSQELFVDGVAPAPVDADHRVHDLLVRTFYVTRDAENRPGFPALRIKALDSDGASPVFVDSEVMPGVEDLQVQFGIDTGDYDDDGVVDPQADLNGDGIPESDGRATRYVNPDFPDLDRLQVVSVRLWLRVRGEQPEPELDDRRTYRYADVEYTPAGEDRRYRRLLLTRTIMLRNSRTL
jgi:type IV pilus assembly protein PilW